LNAEASSRTAALCGRNAVQIRPGGATVVDLKEIAERLRAVGQVQASDYLLRFQLDGMDMTLFPDARAIVKGTSEPAAARAFYARYVGG
jgi:adenylyltransferase/sulfurtransferase